MTISINDLQNQIKNIRNPLYEKRPIVTFIDDDGKAESYSRIFTQVFKGRIKATFAIITSKIGTPGYLTLDNIKEMQAAGNTFVSHSSTHDDAKFSTVVSSTPDSYFDQEFSDSKQWFANNGLNVPSTIVYPDANFDHYGGTGQAARIKAIARKYYEYGVNADGWFNGSPIDNMYIKRWFPDFTAGDTYQSIIDKVITPLIQNNGWLIIGTHAWSSAQFPNDQIIALINYLNSQNVLILPFEDALKYKDNALSIGEYTDPSRSFFVGKDGQKTDSDSSVLFLNESSNIATDTPYSSFATGKITVATVTQANDKLDSNGGVLVVNNLGKYYCTAMFYGGYGQKLYMNSCDNGNWRGWQELTAMPTSVRSNSYSGIMDSPVSWYPLNKITNICVQAADDNLKGKGGMLSIYRGAAGFSYAKFEPIGEFHVYKRIWNDSTSAWGAWTVIS